MIYSMTGYAANPDVERGALHIELKSVNSLSRLPVPDLRGIARRRTRIARTLQRASDARQALSAGWGLPLPRAQPQTINLICSSA